MDKDIFYNFYQSLENTILKLESCKEILDVITVAATQNVLNDMAVHGVSTFMKSILEELKEEENAAFDFYKNLDQQKEEKAA